MPWSADIVIVGSGVAGSLVATRLARAGLKVLILEAGPRVQRSAALAQYRDALIKIPESPYPDAPYASHPVSDNPDHYYLQDGPDKFAQPVSATGRRHHVALAGHDAAFRSRRLQAALEIRRRRGLADLVRRSGAVVLRSRA